MTEKKTYWLVDAENNYAAAAGAEVRDALLPLGWREADLEPTGAEFVWCQHPDVAEPAKVPAETLPVWQARGWEPSYPFAAGGLIGAPLLDGQDAPPAAEPPPVLVEAITAADELASAPKPKKSTPAAGGTSSRES